MSNRLEILFKLWKNFNFRLDSLPERIRLQKTIYILAKLKYPGLSEYLKDYGFYIHGPYSTLLAKDAFSLSCNQSYTKAKERPFTDEEFKKINLFNKIFDEVKNAGIKTPDYIDCELIGDIIYFCNSGLISTDEELFQKLIEKKSYFNDKDKFRAAVTLLREHSII